MPLNQTISTTVSGPIFSTGGFISVTSSGTIDGGPTGVAALSFSITTLSNSGSIFGRAGTYTAASGGTGVLNRQTITRLINGGTIAGGKAGLGTSIIQALAKQLGANISVAGAHPGTKVSIVHAQVPVLVSAAV